MKASYDIAIAGSGFAGSLLAMIAKRLGYSVVLLERGKHPRIVIGESSTPLANLLLEELCRRYDLPTIAPLAKWGTWQREYPQIGCGLKRGFTFYHHRLGEQSDPSASFDTQLLVAASPHDEIGDTHWYRADFDEFLVKQAQALGVDYFDLTQVERIECDPTGVGIAGSRFNERFSLRANFLIDATGPRGLLHRVLRLEEEPLPDYPKTQALWSHFEGVRLPDNPALGATPPYPPESAAVHHVFDGGWIWVLRFNNGITSAGVAATNTKAADLRLTEGEPAWNRLLDAMPALKDQFKNAKATQPLRHLSQLSFLSAQIVGERWALLPSAAGFVDPLLSTGFPLTLLGIERITRILEANLDSPHLASDLQHYAQQTRDELLATARLIGALYANMGNFDLFRSLCLLYFAAASYSETARRLGKPQRAQSFLLHDDASFGSEMKNILSRAMHAAHAADKAQLQQDTLKVIEPIDMAGLGKPSACNWYPVDANDLLYSRAKVGATKEEIEVLLDRCGFYESKQQ